MNDKGQTYISITNSLKLFQSQIKETHPYAIKMGFNAIDILTGGFFPGELCVVGARPLMGKTGFVLSCISNMLFEGLPVALFSASDYLSENFMARLVCAIKDEERPYDETQRHVFLQEAHLDEVPLFWKCSYTSLI